MTTEELEWSDYGRERSLGILAFDATLFLACVAFDIAILRYLWGLLWGI